jgi:hypothetical protein
VARARARERFLMDDFLRSGGLLRERRGTL